MDASDLYRPPAPKPKSIAGAIAAATLLGQRDILSLLPEDSYRSFVGRAPVGKRPILIINNPQLVRQILIKDVDRFPKSDLMVGALTPLVGDGIFISGGERWAHQRRLIDPAFAHMRIRTAFTQMQAATTDFEARLDEAASRGEELEFKRCLYMGNSFSSSCGDILSASSSVITTPFDSHNANASSF